MTVLNQIPKSGPYYSNGVTTNFVYNFKVFSAAEMVVTVTNGVTETTLTLTTHYSVLDVGESTGEVSLTGAGLALAPLGSFVNLRRQTAIEQQIDLQNNGEFFADTVEQMVDRSIMVLQDFDVRLTDLSVPASSATAEAARDAALIAQVAAEAARDATLLAYDNFDDRYLGAKVTPPALDNDGNALVGGMLYFDTPDGEMKVWTGVAWVAAYVSGAGFLQSVNNLSDLGSAATARTNLGLGAVAEYSVATLNEAVDDRVAVLLVAGSNVTLTYDDVANTITVDAISGGPQIQSPVATTSGTFIDISTSIPATAKRIIVQLNEVSTNGTSPLLIQIGDAGGVETTGYNSSGSIVVGSAGSLASTAGFVFANALAAALNHSGLITLMKFDANTYICTGHMSNPNGTGNMIGSGQKALSAGPLTTVRLTTVNGTDTFDAGSVCISWE